MLVIMIRNWRPAGFSSDSGLRTVDVEPKPSFSGVLGSTVEASGDIHFGSKGRVQESAPQITLGVDLFQKHVIFVKKKEREIWRVHKIQSNIFIFLASV